MIIKIKNFKTTTIVGVHAWEKNTPREVIYNVEIEIDCNACTASDDILDTVDYDKVSEILVHESQTQKFSLIEKLAHHVALKIKNDFKAKRVKVELDKPGAVKLAESVSVTYEV